MKKILLIEDDPYMLESLEQFLKFEGFDVVAVVDGFKAIEKAQENEFALVITDVRMAGMDGIEALGRVGLYQPNARKIVITAYADQDAPLRAIQVSVDDYLMKPFGSEAFLKSVKNALSRYRLEKEKAEVIQSSTNLVTKLIQAVIAQFAGKLPGGSARSSRLAELCRLAGEMAGLSVPSIERLGKAVLWHDFALVLGASPESHGADACGILSALPAYEEAASILSLHHETGEAIPIEAKILGLCEAYQNILVEKKVAPKEALDFLCASSNHDPSLVGILSRVALASPEESSLKSARSRSRLRSSESLLRLAQVYSSIGETELAGAALAKVADCQEVTESQDFRCRFMVVSAQNAIRQRNFVEGYRIAEEALELALSSNLGAVQVAKIFLEMALAGLFLSNPERVEEMLEKAKEIFGKHEDRRNGARTNLYLAIYDLTYGKKERWRSLLEICQSLIGHDQMEEWLQSESFALSLPVGSQVLHFFLPPLAALSKKEIKIHSLGAFRVYRNGILIKEEEWKSKKAKLLLAYLLFNMERPVSEERLCERFWPEGDERSRKNLHQTVYLLRRALEPNLHEGNQSSYILPQRNAYQFNRTSPYWWDVAEFKKCWQEAEQFFAAGSEKDGLSSLLRMEGLYQGELLEDYPEETWCETDREKLREIYLEGSLRLARHFENEGQFKSALDLISRALSLDSLHETAAIQQVRVLFRSGMRSEAIRKYHDWCDTFKRELNLGPPPGLVSLYLEMTGSPT